MNKNTTAAQPLDAELIAKQVASWRSEIARLQDLIAHASGSTGAAQLLDLDKQRAEFETAYFNQYPNVCHVSPDKLKRDESGDYADGAVFVAWDMWLIAQARATQPAGAADTTVSASIDTPEFRALAEKWQLCLTTDIERVYAELVAYIDSRAAQPVQAGEAVELAPMPKTELAYRLADLADGGYSWDECATVMREASDAIHAINKWNEARATLAPVAAPMQTEDKIKPVMTVTNTESTVHGCDWDSVEPGTYYVYAAPVAAQQAAAKAPAAQADYTVDDSELARKIMVFLGRATTASMEPGADPLRDRLAERLALWRPAASPASTPEASQQAAAVAAPRDYVLMPKRLTAENGAKAAMIGEFYEEITVRCPDCDDCDEGQYCAGCNDEGTVQQPVQVQWDTIKQIYTRAVELLAAPATAVAATTSEDARDALAEHIAMIKESGWKPSDGQDQSWQSAVKPTGATISEEDMMKIGRKWMRGREEHRGANDFLFTRTKFLKMVSEAIDAAKQEGRNA